jgi:NADPH-dependent glutamate synthase beta subunit-like oxidoreductase
MSGYLQCLSDNIKVDKNKCVFCGTCVETCLLDNLRLKVSPCRTECPLEVNCQGYVQLIARGQFDKAAEIIRKELPFPGIIGRICHHPCESVCKRNEVDGQPVALRVLKKFIADSAPAIVDTDINEERPQKVAIIGGGPAGAIAAYNLRKNGYQVSIFESGSGLGGMLIKCIPEYKLPHSVALQELNQLKELGVDIRYNTTVGKDILFKDILKMYDAIILAVGWNENKKLGLVGEEANNVYSGIDFLNTVKKEKEVVIGPRVAVIGGGNTSIDVARTALRLGVKDVKVFCLEQREEMPAFDWEIKEALNEGIIIENGWGPSAFFVENDLVREIELKHCLCVFNKNGDFQPLFEEGLKRSIEVDTVIVAIGQESDLGFLNGSGLECENGSIKVDPITLQSNVQKVFAAGDIVSGPKTAIEALAQGKEAAESVRRFLEGMPLKYGRKCFTGYQTDFIVDLSCAEMIPRIEPKKQPGFSFTEIECGITAEQAIKEAQRCLSCGEPYGKYRNCWQCLACEVECPEEALEIEVPYLMR